MTTFITGDRSFAPLYPGLIALELLRAVNRGEKIVTGDNDGVEAFTRALCESAGVAVEIFPTPLDAAGKPAWDWRHTLINDRDDTPMVVVVHADPHASHIARSVITIVDESRVRLASPLDLVI